METQREKELPSGRSVSGRWRWPTVTALLVAILLTGLGLRAYLLAHTEAVARDGAVYVHFARDLATRPAGEVVREYDYHPGYPAAIAIAASCRGAEFPRGWVRAGQWVSVLASLITVAGVFVLGWAAMGDVRLGLASAMFVALSPAYALTSVDAISDALAVGCSVACVALAVGAGWLLGRASVWSLLPAGLAGLAAGFGYLTRPEELLAAVVGIVVLLLTRCAGRRAKLLRVAAVVVLAAGAVVCVAPYMKTIGGFSQKKKFTDFVRTPLAPGGYTGGKSAPKGSTLRTPDPDGGTQRALVSPLRQGFGGQAEMTTPAVAAVVSSPAAEADGGFFSHVAKSWEAFRRTMDRGRAAMGTPYTVAFMLTITTWIGALLLGIRVPPHVLHRPTRVGWAIVLLPSLVMLPLVMALEFTRGPVYVSSRHTLLAAMFLAPAAAAGIQVCAGWTLHFAGQLHLRRLPWLAYGGWTVAFAAMLLANTPGMLHEGKHAARVAGLELRRLAGPGLLVLGDDARSALWAGAPAEQFRRDTEFDAALPTADLDPNGLAHRLGKVRDGRQYQAVILTGGVMPDDQRDAMLAVPPRMGFRLVFQTRDPPDTRAWVFLREGVREGRSDTDANAAAGPGRP